MLAAHGKQCICQICTCGRHRCPHYRNQSQLELGGGANAQDQDRYHRKEFATATTRGYERVRPTVRRGDATLSFIETDRPRTGDGKRDAARELSDDFLKQTHRSELQLRHPTVNPTIIVADAKQRFDTSANLRERGRASQIDLTDGNKSPSALMSTSYREQSESVANSPQERTRSTRPTRGEMDEILRANRTQEKINGDLAVTELTSVNRMEYGAKRVERTEMKRPTTSDHWKTSGSMDGTTVSRTEYAPKRVAPSKLVRPSRTTSVLDADQSATFALETSNLSDYTAPSRESVERPKRIAPRTDNADAFRGNESFESTTVNRSEYGVKRGERMPTVIPHEAGVFHKENTVDANFETSNLSDYAPHSPSITLEARQRAARPLDNADAFKQNGTFDGVSINQSEYSAKRGDRMPTVIPREAGVFQKEDAVDAKFETSNLSDYAPRSPSAMLEARQRAVRPSDNANAFKKSGTFDGASVNKIEYSEKRGDRMPTVIPREAGVFHKEDAVDANFETSNLSDYAPRSGTETRQRAVRPPDNSDAFTHTGVLDARSVNRTEYGTHAKGERYAIVRPRDSDVLKHNGAVGHESTSQRVDYAPKAKGERYALKRPGTSDLWKRDGQMESTSVNRSEYSPKKGEHHLIQRPKDSGIFERNGDTAATTTISRSEFSQKAGDRHPIRKHEDAEIFDRSRKVEAKTVHQSEYYPKSGILSPRDAAAVRARAKNEQLRPLHSDSANKKMSTTTESNAEFTAKRGESNKPKRLTSSDIWKREGAISENTISRDEYTKKRVERAEVQAPLDTLNMTKDNGLNGAAATDYETVSRRDFSRDTTGFDLSVLSLHSDHDRHSQHHSQVGALLHPATCNDDNAPSRSLTQEAFVWHEHLSPNMRRDVSPKSRQESHLNIADCDAAFDANTVYKENYRASPSPRAAIRAPRPPTALKMSGERQLTSGYKAEFDRKRLDDASAACVAGELVDSVKKDHAKTRHFEFRQMNNGHHFYQPRRTPPSKQNTPRG